MKKNPMVMRTRAKWGYTDGLIGLTYGDMLSCKGTDGQKQRDKDKRDGALNRNTLMLSNSPYVLDC